MYDNRKVWVLPILKKLIVTASGRKQQRYSENLFPERQRRVFRQDVKFKYPRQRKTVVADGVGQVIKKSRKSARIYGISLMSLINLPA